MVKQAMQKANPPKARKKAKIIQRHGDIVTDPYDWMRDENWEEVLKKPELLSEDIRKHLESENAHFEGHYQDFKATHEDLAKDILGRIKQDDSSVPKKDGAYEYWARYEEGGNYPIFMRRHLDTGEEQVLFHGEKENKKQNSDYFKLGTVSHSPDQKLLGYSLDDQGSEYYTIRVRQAGTDKDFSEIINNTDGNIVWSKDSKKLYYIERHTPVPEEDIAKLSKKEQEAVIADNKKWAGKTRRMKCHVLGTDPKNDKVIFENDDPALYLSTYESQSGDYIFINLGDHQMTEVHVLKNDVNKEAKPSLVAKRRKGHEYGLDHRGDHFYIKTNKDKAANYKIMVAPVSDPSEKNLGYRRFVSKLTIRSREDSAIPHH